MEISLFSNFFVSDSALLVFELIADPIVLRQINGKSDKMKKNRPESSVSIAGIVSTACVVFGGVHVNAGLNTDDGTNHQTAQTPAVVFSETGNLMESKPQPDSPQDESPLLDSPKTRDDQKAKNTIEFQIPVRLKAGENFIKTDAPGYACPAMFDIDNDGHRDLLVGQQGKGRIGVYKRQGNGFDRAGFLKIRNTQLTAVVKDVW